MAFRPDRRFESLEDAFKFLLGEQARHPVEKTWVKTPSGIVVPQEVPTYLYRGECGEFETTFSNLQRPGTYVLKDGRRLSDIDRKALRQLILGLAHLFVDKKVYELDEPQAYGLFQHYGLPTPLIDFTGELGRAFAFAALGGAKVGRVAEMHLLKASAVAKVVSFVGHPWAERAQRQAAFGVVPMGELFDLKSGSARLNMDIRWFEFPVSQSDQDYFDAKYVDLLRWTNDPSAGFLRFHITEFIQASGKLSPELTDWLLERVPVAPYCYIAKSFEGEDVVVNFRSAEDLKNFDETTERTHSQLYWSSAHPGCHSKDRLSKFEWSPVGEITYDPRTYHPD